MAKAENSINRILQIRFRLPTPDATKSLSMMVQAAGQFLGTLGDAKIRLLRNADDPAQFIQLIEYQADPSFEVNRQKLASDPMLRAYVQTWRTFFPGGVELDIYEDVTGGI
jgi:hypothetical protein